VAKIAGVKATDHQHPLTSFIQERHKCCLSVQPATR
jgi:hypothetical protein